MATMQETLKASSGIDLKELLEGFAGKGAVQQLSSDKPVVSVVEDEKKVEKRKNSKAGETSSKYDARGSSVNYNISNNIHFYILF